MAGEPRPCPPTEVLEGIAVGAAPPPEIRDHLATCEACRHALRCIRDDNQFLIEFMSDGSWRSAADAAPIPVVNIPGYEIIREVHRGGQGVVYLALQHSTKRRVAIKVMKQGPFATLADRARFDREIETLSRLDHPCIVAAHDAGMAAGFQYFVMDYIDGAPLDEALAAGEIAPAVGCGPDEPSPGADAAFRAGGQAPMARLAAVLDLFIKVCDAVNAAHLRGVIHRDLKPSNIRVDRGGEPHVLDFGLAKTVECDDTAMTHTGQFMGSLPWASPEQVEGASAKIDLRTDVYSLGAILYQLLAGAPPFDTGGSLRETFDAILQQDPPRPGPRAAARGLRIDDELETIILKCLSKSRERRYQSAGELARDLRRYLSGDAIDAKRDSAWYMIRKAAWRKRRVLISALVPMLLLPIAGYALHRGATEARLAERERALREVESVRNAAMLEITRRLYARPGSSPDSPGGRLGRLDAAAISADLDSGGLAVSDHGVAMLLAETLRDRGSIVEAEELVRRALFMLQRDHGPQHPEIGRMRVTLADLLLQRGSRMPEAQQTAEIAIQELTRSFGPESPDTAAGWTMLARIKLARGDASGALDAAQQALVADPDPRSIPHVEAHAALAGIRAERGEPAQARNDCLEALRSMLELTHDTDARLLDTLGLGATLIERGVLPAEDLFDRSRLRGALADMTPANALRETAALLYGGADGTARDDNLVPARLVMVALRERLLGPEHPSLGASLASAASSLFGTTLTRDFDAAVIREALALFDQAIPLQIAALGPDSPWVGKSYEMKATCLVELCRFHEATRWYARDCELWMSQPPALRDEYQIMLRARWTAWHATRAGDCELALPWIDRSLEMILRLVGPEHPGNALMHACRALCLSSLGRESEALASASLAERVLAAQTVPEDQRLDCMRFLGLAYLRANRPDDARRIIEPAWQSARIDFERRRPYIRLEWARTMQTYCRGLGDLARAAEFERIIVRDGMGDLKIPPDNHP